MGAATDTLETFLHFKRNSRAIQIKKKKKHPEEKDGGGKKNKTNQEEAGNESNSCITSNAPSSKLHNIRKRAQSESATSKKERKGAGAIGGTPLSRALARRRNTRSPYSSSLSFVVVLRVFVATEQHCG